MIDDLVQPISIRLQHEQRSQLELIAKGQGINLSTLLRKIIHDWLRDAENPALTKVEESKIKVLCEMAHIVRGLARTIDVTLIDEAKIHAENILKSIRDEHA